MKRSPLWWAAYARAWHRLRDAARFVERVEGERSYYDRVPCSPVEIAIECAKEAEACESGCLAAFPNVLDDEPTRLSALMKAAGDVVGLVGCPSHDPHSDSDGTCERCNALDALEAAIANY